MEAEKRHDLPSVSWKPRINSDKIQSESEGLRTRWANDRYESPRAEDEIRCLSSIDEAGKKEHIPASSSFSSVQALSELDDVHSYWGGLFT